MLSVVVEVDRVKAGDSPRVGITEPSGEDDFYPPFHSTPRTIGRELRTMRVGQLVSCREAGT